MDTHESNSKLIEPVQFDRLPVHIIDSSRFRPNDWIAPTVAFGCSLGLLDGRDGMASLYIVSSRWVGAL